ncbi:MAG: AAA domain-containing protein, partial [Flammeovirgaceae bacterium]
VFVNNNSYSLTLEQQKQIIKEVYQNDYTKHYDYELALSEFSIDLMSKGKFVVAFRKLTFDPAKKVLRLGSKTHFNPNFYIQGTRHTLSYYTDMSPVDFEALYIKNKAETIELLKDNFKTNEMPNTRPEIVVLGYEQIDISRVYEKIHSDYQKKEMQIPLKAFFQNLSLLDRKNRSEPHIVLFDRNVNIDQLRSVYNALKFPITYVQGPPGTGKTQTILNVIVNCLANNKTLLISSNNNVPIDGIKDKIYIGKYKGKEIKLPIIRLGNNDCVKQALKTIKELYAFETKDAPKEVLLFNLKEKSKVKNKLLLARLKQYEDRLDVIQNLEFVNALLSKGGNHLLDRERLKLHEKLTQIPEVVDEDLNNLFEVIKDNDQLLQFFYYESLRYIKRLKTKDYTQLVDILRMTDA